jgi:phosphatidylserine/phosphatidylglycerophosphate/cardiolipin synthase-like enzyme
MPSIKCVLRVTLLLLAGMWASISFAGDAALAQESPPLPAAVYLPVIGGAPPSQVLIAAAYIDSSISYEPDEAVLLWNVGHGAQLLAGWSLTAGAKRATFPLTSTLTLDPGARLWCTANTAQFRQSFGVEAGCAWASADQAALLLQGELALANSGGALTLTDAEHAVVDLLLYANTTQQPAGWLGAPAELYTRGLATSSGQLWQRKLDPEAGLPVDTDTAHDWAGDLADASWGRRVRQPGWGGWGGEDGLWPPTGVGAGAWSVAIGPEGLYTPLSELLNGATQSIDLSLYTLEHPALAQLLASVIGRGVHVRLLLDGAPPGGISDLQRWCVREIAAAGGDVRYLALADDAPNGYKRRYRFTHAKYGVVDGRRVFVGTENLTRDAMPLPSDQPVGGRRGFYLFTDAAGVAAALRALFAADWRPALFADMHPYDPADAKYGAPPADFVLPEAKIYEVAESPFADVVRVEGVAEYALVSAPENALRPDAGMLVLLAAAGPGDEITMMQMYEDKYWGEGSSNPIADPNPRLEAAIAAARRGARVRLLLDSYFDDADELRSNQATVEYVRSIAAAEGLNLEARTGNPTEGGIHAKLVLVRLGERRWSAVGSLNGGETSHKLNREVVLLVEQRAIYDRLYSVFEHDWRLGE